ncbi:AsmA family protein [Hyphomonas oceanitis]|uniref:AsmA family protein n=1 Tax=Hyphomonas oceanitis TaxID=81033 RepID=UPI00300288FA
MKSLSGLSSLERTAFYICAALLTLAVLVLAFLLAMTQPRFATPVVNRALNAWGPDGARVASAHLAFPRLSTLVLSGADVPQLAEVKTGALSANVLGFLPGIPWLSEVSARDGRISLAGSDDKDSARPDVRKWVDHIDLANIDLAFNPEKPERTLKLVSAEGSVQNGNVTLHATGADSEVRFEGSAKASGGSTLGGRVRIKGDNMADIARLVGLAAPDTPPYNLTAQLAIKPGAYDLDDIAGTVGDSDLAGSILVDLDKETPYITADIKSNQLDFDDLGVIFALPFGTGNGETVGKAQRQAKEAYQRDSRLIPNIEIDFARLDAVDGQVHYVADTVINSTLDLTGVELDFTITGRVVKAKLARFAFNEGTITAYATLDGTQQPAQTNVVGSLDHVALASLSLDKIARGNVDGEFKADMSGNRLRDAFGRANGSLSIWSTDTQVLALGSEALGLDLGEALVLLASEDKADPVFTPARCLAVVVDINKGIGTLNPAVLDTEDSLIVMKGDVDLETEALDIKIRSDAKDASWGTLVGNVSLGGTLRQPSVNPLNGKAVLQVGLAVVLAQVAGPLAALPFIETGSGQDAPCGALLSRAKNAQGEG